MKYLLIGAAAAALAASGAYADPGNGNGNGGKNGGQQAAHGSAGKKAGGNERGAQRAERQDKSERKAQGRAEARVERRIEARADARAEVRRDRRDDDRREARSEEPREDRREVRRYVNVRDGDDRIVDRVVYRDERRMLARDRDRVIVNGCPPGLAKKDNGCMPPGLAKKRYAERSLFGYEYRPRLFGLSSYDSGRYYYDDGYLFRLGDRGAISGFIPLLGGALTVGNPWPTSYTYYDVPNYYVDYYNLGSPNSYRYADNVIYRVDPQDAAILGVAALLTGDDIQIGQPMPVGYDVYNVPYAYRDRYRDGPDGYYRYSDGYVYRIDPTTQLVAAAIDLVV